MNPTWLSFLAVLSVVLVASANYMYGYPPMYGGGGGIGGIGGGSGGFGGGIFGIIIFCKYLILV